MKSKSRKKAAASKSAKAVQRKARVRPKAKRAARASKQKSALRTTGSVRNLEKDRTEILAVSKTWWDANS